jgi:hypothetical protein
LSQAASDRWAWINRWGLGLILTAFVACGVWYSLVIPAFETPDELYHYGFVRHLAQGNPLPVQAAQSTGPWAQEGSQAPLYYWLAGRLTAGIDQSDFATWAVINPRANMGDPLFPGNKNRMLYSAAAWPLVGSNLALHVARWLSLALGVITLVAVAATARLALPRRLWLLPPAILAFIPQFVFISASCTNDSLIIAASAVGVWWLARLVTVSAARPIHLTEWLILGCMLGVAALSKLQGLGLWLLAAGTGAALAWQQRDLRLLWRAALPVALPALAIAGWWYWRNYTLYGDWSGLEHLTSINGQRTEPLEWDSWWLEFRGLRYSFWGLFGWFNLLLPNWVYRAFDGVSVLALAGLVGGAWLRRDEPAGQAPPRAAAVRLLCMAWTLLSFALVLYWVSRAIGSQGRLFFPAIGATVVLLVWGLDAWLRRLPRWGARLGWTLWLGLLVGATLYTGAWLLPHAYAAPAPLTQLPATATPLDITYAGVGDEQIVLLGASLGEGRYFAGDRVPVTLYLTTPGPLQHDYEVFVQLLDEGGEVVGNVTTHPGWGSYPTTLWEPGTLFADTYAVQVQQRIDPHSPLLARVYTGFVDPTDAELRPLSALSPTDTPLLPILGTVTLLPWSGPDVDALGLTPLDAEFGESLRLAALQTPTELDAGATMTVTLLWEAASIPNRDYTAFVHLLSSDGTQVGGFDQAAGGARFPTHAWQPGDRIVGTLPVQVAADTPPGLYTLWVGLYDGASAGLDRLPVTADSGLPSANEMLQIGTIQIHALD